MKKTIFIFLIIIPFINYCKKARQASGVSESKIKPSDYLSSSKYKSLQIDFCYEQGHPPSPETINNVKSFLQERLNKPSGIQFFLRAISGSAKAALNIADVADIERKHRSYYSDGSILTAFVYLANSDYSDNQGSTKALGIQYNVSSVVLFGKTLQEYSGSLTKPSYSVLETTVLEHEFGHLLGLVDNGSPMVAQHIDGAHGRHCSNKSCLMYYLAETSDIVSNLLGGSIPVLDNSCINDLRNNGGK
jgi:hypothetical protein